MAVKTRRLTWVNPQNGLKYHQEGVTDIDFPGGALVLYTQESNGFPAAAIEPGGWKFLTIQEEDE